MGRERAPLAGLARDADRPAEQARELSADGQAQAGAAALARVAAVGLLERLENDLLLLCRDADPGVDDRERDALVTGGRDVERDAPLAGELEGIGEQILQHLLEAGHVGADRGGRPWMQGTGELT